MSTADEGVEILIGKLLDGEITPAEQRVLDSELERSAEAKELLKQLRSLHESGGAVVTQEVLRAGASSEAIFQRAWQRSQQSLWRRVAKADGHLRFAVGLAAGFLLGVLLHFVLVWGGQFPADTIPQTPIAGIPPGDGLGAPGEPSVSGFDAAAGNTREVDWFVFTDGAGGQWVVEGVREGMIRNAAYEGGL